MRSFPPCPRDSVLLVPARAHFAFLCLHVNLVTTLLSLIPPPLNLQSMQPPDISLETCKVNPKEKEPGTAAPVLTHVLVHRARNRHTAKSQVPAPPRQEPQRALPQRRLAQHVLALGQDGALNGALAPPVELPQPPVVGLDEAHVVEVDVVLGGGGRGGALRGGRAVCVGELRACLEEGGALCGGEGDGLLEEGV